MRCHFCQLSGTIIGIYPIETLKTQMMSSTEGTDRALALAARRVWALGGLRAYYRGLGVRKSVARVHAHTPQKSLNHNRLAWSAYSRTFCCLLGRCYACSYASQILCHRHEHIRGPETGVPALYW